MKSVELVPVGETAEAELLRLARAFHLRGRAPAHRARAATLVQVAHGHPLARAWLIHEAGRTVGYTILCLGFGIEYGGPDAFVDDLYLVPDARGRGVGATVMQRLEAEARAMGLCALFLVVDPENAPARRPLSPSRLRGHGLAADGEATVRGSGYSHSSLRP